MIRSFSRTRFMKEKKVGLFMQKKIVLFLIVLIVLSFPGVSMAKLAPGDFIDIKGSWAEQEIQTVCNLGLMKGTGTTAQGFRVFSPEALVTRSQLASVMVRTFQLDYGLIRFFKEPLASDYYRDVANKAWYAGDVVMCAINKIFAEAERFSPDTAVSRIDLARAIEHAFTAKGITAAITRDIPGYEDIQALSQQDLNTLIFACNTGIMRGDGQNFRPRDTVKRAELASVLKRCSELIAVNERNDGRQYTVKVGQTFGVSLASNPTTGYGWTISETLDEKVLAPSDGNYLSVGDPNKPMMGQGGRTYWKFTALKAGQTELKMVYARPWESVQPAQTFTLKVMVNE